MKILFVYNDRGKKSRHHLVITQGNALMKKNVHVDFFEDFDNKITSYITNIPKLKKLIKENGYDIIHAQFGLSGFTSSFIKGVPIVVSLTGDDFHLHAIASFFTRLFSKLFWEKTIVKSDRMFKKLKYKDAVIIPNGIDFSRFTPIDREIARNRVGFNSSAHVLWVSDPQNKKKNFALAREAFSHITTEDVELTVVNNVELDKIPYYYYAADVLLVTSKWEGSPNVVKEALACCLPVVSTDVGDVADITKDVENCYIVNSNPKDLAYAIDAVLECGKRNNGREKIKHMDVNNIADLLIKEYKDILNKKK